MCLEKVQEIELDSLEPAAQRKLDMIEAQFIQKSLIWTKVNICLNQMSIYNKSLSRVPVDIAK